MPEMRSPADQIAGLKRLADLVGKSECNTMIKRDLGDVAALVALHTPNASEVVYAVGGYDVWAGGHLQATDLSIEDAAKVVVAEYHLAKAARIRQHSPHLSVDEIMARLAKGYQKKG